MNDKESQEVLESWIGVFLGVIAFLTIKSIFENDNSKIISKKGQSFLSDEETMKDINKKIQNTEKTNSHNEVLI